MRVFGFLAIALLAPVAAQASETSDLLASHLYAGTLAEGQAAFAAGKDAADPEACFGWGLLSLAGAVEGLAQDFYRHGATVPGTDLAARLLGGDGAGATAPANPAPEKLSYAGLRSIFSDFRSDVAAAQAGFLCGGVAGSDYVVDVLQARLDLNGDGQTGDGETLGAFLAPLLGELDGAAPDEKSLSKGVGMADATVGFDAADAIWFAGYSQIVLAHVDLVLAHDFEGFFDAYRHRVFPQAGLPMQDYAQGGTLMVDPDSDAGIADIIAAIHTLNFPVIDRPLLASIPEALGQVTALSRRNWDLILAETDDRAELIPNPGQTPLFGAPPVTDETVTAWRETLDVLDQIIAGDLLIPHWRFSQGFDLRAFFETAERTDLVLLLTGQAALPYLRDGPIADAQSFAAGNAVFGENFFNFALWFN